MPPRHPLLVLTALRRYLAELPPGRAVLWCYAIWYAVNVANHFDPAPRIWITALAISVIVGMALLLSTSRTGRGRTHLDGWSVFRLFLMPFCVSSYSATVKDAGYILIFPPNWKENIIAGAGIVAFLALLWIVKALNARIAPLPLAKPAR
jgi:ABC-type uncharacterized transport system permease subunit